jgi:hypothetical protein
MKHAELERHRHSSVCQASCLNSRNPTLWANAADGQPKKKRSDFGGLWTAEPANRECCNQRRLSRTPLYDYRFA